MIFVTIGTQEPFDRFIRIMDELAPALGGEEIVAQTCGGDYRPLNMRVMAQVSPTEFDTLVDEARLVVSHAGMGTILTAMQKGKPIVIFPRDASLGEHRNDHQRATASLLEERGWVYVARDAESLRSLLTDSGLRPLHNIKAQASDRLPDYLMSLIKK